MLADQVPRSFIMKNNNYSHCPLKKRPVPVLPAEDEVKRRPESLFKIKKEDDSEQSVAEELIVVDDIPEPENLSTKPEDLSRSADKSPLKRPISPEQAYIVAPPMGITPMHPVAKKARVEVLQHESSQYLSGKSPLEPLNLNTPVEPLSHYAPPSWAPPPMYPSHYLPYHASYPMYPAYPVPAYPDQSAVSPPLTCTTIQRPIARSYASHWDHCAALSPTSSLRSPPPVTPEDLSSPGSESGRSSAGSTSAGPAVVKSHPGSTSSGPSSSAPRYQCPDCGKSYSTYSGLSKHQQFHCAAAEGQAKKSFSCKYCEKVYVSLGALKMHIRTHTLPCKCHLCGKAFSRPWLLQGHIRTHTGEKPFSCQHCNRAFADRSNLRAHLQTHSDVKKYSCSSCSKTFSRMSLLTKHQEGGCPGVSMNPLGYAC